MVPRASAPPLIYPAMGEPLRALLLLGQSPFDPASGAARSMQTMARWLARAKWSVRALSTNASESPQWATGLPDNFILSHGVNGFCQVGPLTTLGPWRHLSADGVSWEWLPTTRQYQWEHEVGHDHDQRLRQLLQDWRPHLVLSYGDDPGDQRRRRMCRDAGARLVFALHNRAYLGRQLDDVDRFLAPSEHLAHAYRASWGLPVDVLPMPIELVDIESPDHEPLCALFVNPEPAKGRQLVARLAAHLVQHRPDIPLMVVTGRAGPQAFLQEVQRCGADITRASNLLLATDALTPRQLFRWCRVCLVPSVVEESGGRVVAEAQSVGAVPLVSDRGALPETLGPGGRVLQLPHGLIEDPHRVVSEEEARPWLEALISLMDNEKEWMGLSEHAKQHAQVFHAAAGVPRYDAWARDLISQPITPPP